MFPPRFEWDPRKRESNVARHEGVDFPAACRMFEGPVVQQKDDRTDYGEERIIAVGVVEVLCLAVVFTWRGQRRRRISARRASRGERARYAREVSL